MLVMAPNLSMVSAAGEPWDLSSASYDNVSFSIASEETYPSGIVFKSDGTKMYVIGYMSDSVHQYSLSTAWDLSSASYDNVSFSIASEEANPSGIVFKSDGTKMYVIGGGSDSVHQYSLLIAWSLSKVSYDNVSFSIASEETNPSGIVFKSDGTKMYVIGFIPGVIYQYSLSTAWDLSSASYDNVSFSIDSEETYPSGIVFKSDGTKMYVIGYMSDSVHQYSLA